jgi:hypothetical protein
MANRIPIDHPLLIEGLGKGLRVIESFSDERADDGHRGR